MVALDAALSDLKEKGPVDHTVCLGDVAAVGPQPKEAIAFLRKMKWPCVMGNSDEALAKSTPEDYSHTDASKEEKDSMVRLDRWTAAQLDASDRQLLSSFKPTITIKTPSASILCYHGSPRSNREGILATTPDAQISEMLGEHDALIYAGGHTHVQMVRRLKGAIVINPGSIGLPYEKDTNGRFRNPTWAEYSIVTVEGQDLGVELCRTRYDLAILEKRVRASGLPEPDWWLDDWF